MCRSRGLYGTGYSRTGSGLEQRGCRRGTCCQCRHAGLQAGTRHHCGAGAVCDLDGNSKEGVLVFPEQLLILLLKLSVLFFQENAAGFFLLQLLFELTAALLGLPKLLLEQIAGGAGLPDLSLGPRLVIADPAGGIFLDPFALLGDLSLGRPGFLQLPAHQDRTLLFLRETVLNTGQILCVLLFRLLHGCGQFALSAGGSFLCLAQIAAELFLAGAPHFHGLVDPALHVLLGRFAVKIEEVQAHGAVFVPDAPDHQFHADRLIFRLVRPPDAEDPAGDGLCSRRLIRIQDQRGHETVAGDAGDLQSVEGIRQYIFHIDAVGDAEHGWNVFAGKKDSGPGLCDFGSAVGLRPGSLRLG